MHVKCLSIRRMTKASRRGTYLVMEFTIPINRKKSESFLNCSARFRGVSLNSMLYKGPHLTKPLVGMLTRLWEDRIAVMADIESMFHQLRVPDSDSTFLRFLWWDDGDTTREVREYQMLVPPFWGHIVT